MDEHVTGEPTGGPDPFALNGGTESAPPMGPPAGPPMTPPPPWAPEVLDSVTAPTWSVLPGVDGTDGGAPTGRRRSRALVAGITAAAVLVTAGGAYAAWSRLNGNGPQPAEVLPAGTVAFAEVDLDPSAGQKLALLNLLHKFPDSSGLKSTDADFGDWLVRRLSEAGSSNDALDFGKDIQPWLGKRFAVAAVPAPAGSGAGGSSVDGVLVVQETDEQAATAAMTKLRAHGSDHLGFAFADGYLVVTPDSAKGAARIVADGQRSSLAADSRFTSDVNSLGSDQVVTAWMDAAKAGQLLKDSLGNVAGVDSGQLDAVLGASWKGRWVLGIHAADESVEMRMRTFGAASSAPQAPPVKLAHVAPDAFAVLAVSGYGRSVSEQWKQLSSLPGYSDIADQARQAGLTLPDDLVALVGDQLTLSVGGDPTGTPSVLAAATSKDPQAGKAVLDKLLALAGPDSVLGVSTTVDGDTLYVGSSDDVVAAGKGSASAAKVTDSDLFRAAVADPDHAQAILYVNLVKLWSSLKASGTTVGSPELQNLKAVGMSATTSGGDSDVTVRVVIG